jgi:hypothetical protein
MVYGYRLIKLTVRKIRGSSISDPGPQFFRALRVEFYSLSQQNRSYHGYHALI